MPERVELQRKPGQRGLLIASYKRLKKHSDGDRLYFLGLQNHCDGDCSHEVKRRLLLGRRAMTNLESILKSKDITLPTKDKGSYSQRNNWCFQTVGLEKTIESPSDSKEIKSINPKGNQPSIFIYWKDWCWSCTSNPLATWHTELTHWKKILMLEKIEGRKRNGQQKTR